MPGRDRKHIIVPNPPSAERYTPHGKRIKAPPLPAIEDRAAHAASLISALTMARTEAARRRLAAGLEVRGGTRGLYVEFDSFPGAELKLESLENRNARIELVAVQALAGVGGAAPQQHATVFVPESKVRHFAKRFAAYAGAANAKSGKPRYADVAGRIAALRLATVRGLWTDPADAFPEDSQVMWWEVWLRKSDGVEWDRLGAYAAAARIELHPRRLEFDERIVTLVHATPLQLAASIDVLDDVAEFRRAKEPASFFVNLTPAEQGDWGDELEARTVPPPEAAPAVCVLDTGVNRGHPLLQAALAESDQHACQVSWSVSDHHGHGTEMAGLALYGDLKESLLSAAERRLSHVLESVKILPPPGEAPNRPDLYGARMAEACSRVEIEAALRRRCFSLAVTARGQEDRGQPTSWSAAIDALAAGRSFDPTTQGLTYLDAGQEAHPRLFVVCAGNVESPDAAAHHLDVSDAQPIRDPGQAWNALTVGAHTELATIHADDGAWEGWQPVAAAGELSPYSCTSVAFAKPWPIKPDVVFEGGNLACSPGGTEVDPGVPSLSVLTTHHRPAEKLFVISNATSAATAQVAHIAGQILAAYPNLWPEAVRALILHSAEWTPRMRAKLDSASGKRGRLRLVRRYGFGVPDGERALRSADNALTLIAQSVIHPFADGRMREMHVHALPWPREALEALDEAQVRLRVTLSYFVEPHPARRGWRGRYQYASHGLRFEVCKPTESLPEFRKRLNRRALEEEEEERPSTGGDTQGWYLGDEARSKGSLHADIWTGSAADLAARGHIGVFPVRGWWKEQPKRDRSEKGARYVIVVSIETERTDVDIWTPVAEQVGVQIEI